MIKLRTVNDILPTATWEMQCSPSFLSSDDNYLGLYMGREYLRRPMKPRQLIHISQEIIDLLMPRHWWEFWK